jgi:DNA-binding NtrC family response regulator
VTDIVGDRVSLSPETKNVLVVDDDPITRAAITKSLKSAGYNVFSARHGDECERRLRSRGHDAILASMNWNASSAPRRIRDLKQQGRSSPLVLLSEPGRIHLAIEGLRHGADDYMIRPPDPAELSTRLARLLDRTELDSRIAFFQDELSKRAAFKSLEARSPSMRKVLDRVLRVAPMRSTVLIHGESGVGKELVARAIHFNSPRRDKPFMALNCAAMPSNLIESELFGHEKGSFTGAHARVRGKFEIAHKGTLFLDEIAETEPSTQAKLLRVLEEREFMRVGGDRSIRVDVRVITATNADLAQLVTESRFRQDLYYRLKVVTMEVPALRERQLDLPALTDTFLSELARANAVPPKTITHDAVAVLQKYSWPGNVRELKNLLESLLVSVSDRTIRVNDLPPSVRQDREPVGQAGFTPGTTLADAERELIRMTLEHTGGNRTHSASLLGIGVRTLQRKIQSFGLTIPPTRRRPRRATATERETS